MDAIRRVEEDRMAWGGWKGRYKGNSRDESGGDSPYGTRIWFGRTGIVGDDGRERWGMDFESRGGEEVGAM